MNKALASLCLFAFAGLVFSAGISLIETVVVNVHHSFESNTQHQDSLLNYERNQ